MIKVRSILVTPFIVALLAGCETPHHAPPFERIAAGMTEEQVTERIGKPEKVAVHGQTKYLEYQTYFHTWKPGDIGYEYYYVRLVNGKVDSYGKKGDFDSTRDPTQRVILDQTVDVRSRPSASAESNQGMTTSKFDLRAELEKFDKLRSDGLISEKEHQELRQRAIEKAKVL